MLIYLQFISCDALSLLLLVTFVSIYITKATSSSSFTNDYNNIFTRQAEEYIMTSAAIDGIKRSNVCGDGYRIEGALLKSYPFSKRETYLPYEDCYMTFQARRSNNQIRIRVITLDLNDIHGGVNCFDSLRFYKSAYIKVIDRLDSIECGQLTEADNFNFISSTGIVTAHFNTDGGNVNGLGFKVVLTAFRYPNKTHPCDPDDDEFLCTNGECISSLLLCDGVAHCLDGLDEMLNRTCISNILEPVNNKTGQSKNRPRISKHHQWRGILIVAFLLIILIVFIFFMTYLICRRCLYRSIPLMNEERTNYSTIVNTPINGPKTSPTTRIIIGNNKSPLRFDDDYNLI